MDNLSESETHIGEMMVNAVLSCETEAQSLDLAEAVTHLSTKHSSPTKFRDGHSLINAFKVIKEMKSPAKATNTMDEQKWQIWYWKKGIEGDRRKWEDFLQMKSSFTSRKEFWSAYNEVNGYEFGLLCRHFDYCVFKDGIIPMWEDSANLGGGRWILEFPRKRDWRHISYLDQIWLKVLLAITGNEGQLHSYVNEICGAVLMIRYNINKIAVWTKNSNNTLTNLMIGELLKASTGFNGKMYYLPHDSTIKKIVVKAEHKIRFDLKPVSSELSVN